MGALTGHIAGVPLEELAPLASGAGALWIALRAWAAAKVRRLG